MKAIKSKIAFVIPQFGLLPDYVHYFIRSASYAAGTLDLIFITDQRSTIDYGAANVFFHPITLAEFNTLCRKKLGVTATVKHGYKLCDLKPMYGLIFEDYLKGYEFWAHGDFDMIFGDIATLLKKHAFDKYDIFAVQEMYASGPFQIFRNTEKVNRLFQQSTSWQEVFNYPQYVGFDEAGDIIRELWKGKSIWECQGRIQSMTHLLKNRALLEKLQISVYMKELITEGFTEGTELRFNKGILTLHPPGTELYIYHFMNRKGRLAFNDQLFNKKVAGFTFSDKGFYTGNKVEFFVGLILSLVKRYKIRIVRKLK